MTRTTTSGFDTAAAVEALIRRLIDAAHRLGIPL